MAFKDLREFIKRLEQEKEVVRINREVDWNLEIGAIMRRVYELKAPAPFFQKIKHYSEEYKIFGCPIATSKRPGNYLARIAIAMDMSPNSSAKDIIEEYLKRKKNPIKPVYVKDAPSKENIHIGNDINLFEFPVPFLHEGDGGRYIGTWHSVIVKDPGSDWTNYGMYRLMVHDEKTMGGLMNPNQHMGIIYYQKYEKMGKPMEFAVAIGTEPVTALISATRIPPGVNETEIIGAIRQEPLELIKCETVNLMVPANSEIVIEGVVNPGERKEEGPFGEYTGYRASDRAPRPVYRVKAITHRNNPILPVCCPGVPVDDDHIILSLNKSAEILDDLRNRGFPVRMVYCPFESTSHMTIVSTKVPFPNYARHLANAIWGSPGWGRSAWYLIIVEDDIDVTNMEEVIWALTTRCHPEKGIFTMPNIPGMPLLPFLNQYERTNSLGAYVLFDCTWPSDWQKETIPVKASFGVMWPKDIQEKVLRNWKNYGYEE